MAARPGMTLLIQELRRRTDTAENQTVVNGVSYWTDDQLQDILDQYQRDVLDVRLIPYPMYEAGVLVTKRYYMPDLVGTFIEDDPSVFQVVDALGNVATGYTRTGRLILFNSDTGGVNYYLRCRTYDMVEASARVWLEKAGHRASLIDWKAGGQTLSEDQEYQHCLQQYNMLVGRLLRTTRLTHTGYYGQ